MSGKNDRERENRRQRKREKRAAKAKRSSRRTGSGGFGGQSDPRSLLTPASIFTIDCVETCELLLNSAGGLDPEERRGLLSITRHASGIWHRLPLALDGFLHDGAPWSLTCADLEPVRRTFVRAEAEEAFDRLWVLALTNEPDGAVALTAAEDADCAQRATVAFHALWRCLEDSANDPVEGLGAVAEEMARHDANRTLQNSYRRLLSSAVASVHAPSRSRAASVDKLVRTAQKLFARESARQAGTAWWQCGRLFLAEVFDRHARGGYAGALAHHRDLVAELFDAPRAAERMARHGADPESMRSVSFQTDPEPWLRFLRQRIDPRRLSFEDRLRYDIARVKILRARAQHATGGGDTVDSPDQVEFLAAFGELRGLLAHGVPPASRALPALLEAPLVDFFINAVSDLHCEDAALPATDELLQRHPDDFRLACLYATGVLMRGKPHQLGALAGRPRHAHIDAQLFARCARVWVGLPLGRQAAAAARPLLFDGLDREHRKHCLLTLAREALRRARSIENYNQELRLVLPFFERDNFVYRELGEETALESGLVFLATMMAPLNNVRLSLTENQSRQWVSHAREIAQQYPLGAALAAHYLKKPSRWFTLAPGVAEAARSRLDDFRPAPPPTPAQAGTATPSEPKRWERRGRKARSSPSASARSRTQPSLFDGLDP
jgi:hypothetical protein